MNIRTNVRMITKDEIAWGDEENPTVTYETVDPTRVLSAAIEASLEHVFVLGVRHDGKIYAASSSGDDEVNERMLAGGLYASRHAGTSG